MATADSPVHLLSLKVMRISRPELASAWQPFYSSSPSFSAHSSASILSLQGNNPLPGHPKTLRDLTHASELLTLPASFGSIQLGETFSSCLCINNETEVTIEVTKVKVEMQTVTTKVVLHETDGSGHALLGGDTLERVVNHEIKELGQHVLACTITYRLPPNSRSVPGASEDTADPSLQTFRKFYKFAVTNPLSVKTKVHSPKSPSALLSPSERGKIFLEVHIQNFTQEAIFFERMSLECTDGWTASDGNTVIDENGNEGSIFAGSMALMHPQDMRQYIYTLVPKVMDISPPTPAPGTIIPLGRLDIFWRSSFGEPGRLLTSMLSRRIPLMSAPQLPASALPPHVKRNIINLVSSRPQSPSISHSRPATPPISQRPSSPALNRPSSIGVSRPQSPQLFTSALPEIEAQLVVQRIPRESLGVEKPFTISFSVIITSTVPLGREHPRRKVKLAIQHIRPRNEPPPIPPVVEAASPRVPSSGFSTPTSSTATFNYALAHQKILAASNRPLATEPSISLSETHVSHKDLNFLPPPYFDASPNEQSRSSMASVSFIGVSAIFLPEIEISFTSSDSGEAPLLRAQAVQDFDLSFIALRSGFSTVGGIRILLIDDQPVDGLRDETAVRYHPERRAHILKEYDVVAEIWVPA